MLRSSRLHVGRAGWGEQDKCGDGLWRDTASCRFLFWENSSVLSSLSFPRGEFGPGCLKRGCLWHVTEQNHLYRDPVHNQDCFLPHLLFRAADREREGEKSPSNPWFVPIFCAGAVSAAESEDREEPFPSHRSFPLTWGERGFLERSALVWGMKVLQCLLPQEQDCPHA